jgi:sulfur carrier protein ThiS
VKVTFKLYAMLSDFLPQEYEGEARKGNVLILQLPDGTSVADVVGKFNLPEKWVHLVLVDGKYVAPKERAGRILNDGEALAIWPPVAGG